MSESAGRALMRRLICLSFALATSFLLIAGTARAQPGVIATIPVGTAPGGIDVSPDGAKVYVVNDVSLDVSVIDTTTNTVAATFANPGGNPGTERGLTFSPDGTEVWVGSGGCVDCIRIFSYPSNAPVATVGGVPGGGTWIDFLPDGSFAFSNNGCGGCGNLQKISTATNSVVSSLFWGNSGRGLAVAPDGSAVYGATTGGGPRVHRVNPSSNSSTGSVPVPADPLGVAITPGGGFLYVALTPTNQVVVVDTSSLTVVDSIPVGTGPWGVTMSPDGSRAYVANGTSDDVSVIDTASNTVVATVAVGDFPRRAAVSADGSRVYVTNTGSNTVSVIGVVYDFSGFFPPVDNLDTLNEVKAGRAIPVKFSLNGDQGLDVFATDFPKSHEINCTSAADQDDVESTVTAGSSSLSYDPATDQYTYVWKTKKSWADTCRQLVVEFQEGTVQHANFKFK